MKIAFNSANLVGRVTGYRYTDWLAQHRQTVKETDAATFEQICGEIAATGFEAVELWQALADPSVMTEELASERATIARDHGLELVGYGGYLGTGAEKVCGWLGVGAINGGFGLAPDAATALCREHNVRTNFENHPQSTVSEILAAVIHKPPDFTALPADTPASIVALVERCDISRG